MTAVLTQSSHETTQQAAALADTPALRRCLATGEERVKAELLRFVRDPSGRVVPDLAGRLPGRGLWVLADRAALEDATRKNLFARAAKTKTLVDPGLPDLVERLLARRCGELLGLARAAGAVVAREPMVLEALAGGALKAVLLATDAGGDIRKKLARAPLVPFGLTREELGAALGREQAVAIGLRAHPLTEKLCNEAKRWQGVRKNDGDASADLLTEERRDSERS